MPRHMELAAISQEAHDVATVRGASSIALSVEDQSDDWSKVSAPARLNTNRCLKGDAKLVGEHGLPITMSSLTPGALLRSPTEGLQHVSVKAIQLLCPAQEHDFILVSVGADGQVEVTQSHEFCARVSSDFAFGRLAAGDLRLGMHVKGSGGYSLVTGLQKSSSSTEVYHVEFEPEYGTALLMTENGHDAIAIYGGQPVDRNVRYDRFKRTVDVVPVSISTPKAVMSDPGPQADVQGSGVKAIIPQAELKMVASGLPSQGSSGHPDRCAGACKHFVEGHCKFGLTCRACHAVDCSPKTKARPGTRARKRAKQVGQCAAGP